MADWSTLPVEIRLMILDLVAEDYYFNSEPYARAGYASVCQEWQPVFEQRNFRQLTLDQERISGLERFMYTEHRRDYLKHLFLRVQLDEYDCTVCQSPEDDETTRNNNYIMSRALWNVLIILSKWTRSVQSRLTLELGAYSLSDSKHTFRDFHLEQGYPYQEAKDLELHWEAYRLRDDQLKLDSINDLYHGWVDGHQNNVSIGSQERIMGTLTTNLDLPEFSTFSQTFPKVKIITGLLIRRQFYRKIAIHSLSKLLREAFICLQWFRHEGWYNINLRQQVSFERDYRSLILGNLPSTLQDLYIFEDFNELLCPERSTQHRNRSLGLALSEASRSLKNLSAAFLFDAKDFFITFWPTKLQTSNVVPWKNLQTLALTSRLLHPEISRNKIKKLLIAAGRTAAFMPRLKVMEIWNGGKGHACVFRYSNDAGTPQIIWTSNWGIDVQLDDDVVSCWSALPNGQHLESTLITIVNRLPRRQKQIKTYAATIRYLRLRSHVLHLISDYQLHWEEYKLLKG